MVLSGSKYRSRSTGKPSLPRTERRAGFPDLIQFWPHEARYRMVEVKGPGDRLQDNQRRFLEFCAGHQMLVFVCQVRGMKRLTLEREVARRAS
jgi:hypothetical protein